MKSEQVRNPALQYIKEGLLAMWSNSQSSKERPGRPIIFLALVIGMLQMLHIIRWETS